MIIATPEQFATARHRLELSISQCARLVNVDERTLRRWESSTDRDPHPSACRILEACLADATVFHRLRQAGA